MVKRAVPESMEEQAASDTPKFGARLLDSQQTTSSTPSGFIKKLASFVKPARQRDSTGFNEDSDDEDQPAPREDIDNLIDEMKLCDQSNPVEREVYDAKEGNPVFTYLPNLCSADLGARVVLCTDEFFGRAENMLRRSNPVAHPDVSDGWETRRRRLPGHDFAVISLACPARIRGIEVEVTGVGSVAPQISVLASRAADLEAELIELGTSSHPLLCEMVESSGPVKEMLGKVLKVRSTYQCADHLPTELIEEFRSFIFDKTRTEEVLPMTRLRANESNMFAVEHTGDQVRWLILNLYPDGGISRFRVYGEACIPPMTVKSEEIANNGLLDFGSALWGGAVVWASSNVRGAQCLVMPEVNFSEIVNKQVPAWRTPAQPLRPPVVFASSTTDRVRFSGSHSVIISLGQRCGIHSVKLSTKGIRGECPYSADVKLLDQPRLLRAGLIEQILIFKKIKSYEEKLTWAAFGQVDDVRDNSVIEIEIEEGSRMVLATHVMISIIPDGALAHVEVYGSTTSTLENIPTPKHEVPPCEPHPQKKARRRDSMQMLEESIKQAFQGD